MSIKKEDLDKYDYYLVIDRSTSMDDPLKEKEPNGITRWQAVEEIAVGIARECSQYDDDGISLYFFASTFQKFENIGGGADKEAALRQLRQLFVDHKPNGNTDTAAVLQDIFKGYLERKAKFGSEVKPIIVIMFTDGRPNDEAAVSRTIIDFTKKLESENEAGLTFLQIGDNQHAREFLKKLDDGLEKRGAKFDIVDTMDANEMESHTLTDILLESVND